MLKTSLLALVMGLSIDAVCQVALVEDADPDITIVNVEDGDRAFIAEIIRKVHSCNPKVIGIDLWFVTPKDQYEDPPLEAALRIAQNDILGYTFTNGDFIRSHRKFTAHAEGEGLALVQSTDDLVSYFTPILQIRGEPHEHIAYKIVKQWEPGFSAEFEINQRVRIKYERTLDKLNHIQGSRLNTLIHNELIENKIVLLGYTGPSDEDKHFTPIRELGDYEEDEPDTYGVVIIANEIRTLIEMSK